MIAGIAVLAVGLLPAGGCTSDSGSSGFPAAGGTDSGGGFSTTPCGSCFSQTCQSETSSCRGDPDCAEFLVCLNGCPVDADGNAQANCVAQCPRATSTAGSDAINALESCRIYASEVECGACGAIDEQNPILNQECAPSNLGDQCFDCYLGNCCDTYQACENNTDCYDMIDCMDACSPEITFTECVEGCFQKLPDGVDEYITDFACWDLFCQEECDFPSASAACRECIEGPCASTKLACETDPECFLTNLCISECGFTAQCFDQCLEGRSDGAVARFEAQFVCNRQRCNGACTVR